MIQQPDNPPRPLVKEHRISPGVLILRGPDGVGRTPFVVRTTGLWAAVAGSRGTGADSLQMQCGNGGYFGFWILDFGFLAGGNRFGKRRGRRRRRIGR